uniref:Uncharacterized protein n=1 Tax=Rhizophora mucronata TaxID=61149 RepID=A0A2P2KQT8_RHIMU
MVVAMHVHGENESPEASNKATWIRVNLCGSIFRLQQILHGFPFPCPGESQFLIEKKKMMNEQF